MSSTYTEQNFDESKHQERQHLLVDVAIILASLVALVISMSLLLDQRWILGSTRSNIEGALGQISKAQADVRKRGAKDYSWNSAQLQEQIHDGDSIYTGPESNAVVQIQSGGEIVVSPSSLIRINQERDRTVIDLKSGSFTGTTQSERPLVIRSGKTQTIIRGNAKVRVFPSVNDGLKVTVTEGQADLQVAQQPSVSVLPDQLVIIDQQKPAPQTISLSAQPIQPLSGTTIIRDTDKPIQFEWKSNAQHELRLQVSKDATFQSLVLDEEVASGQMEWMGLPATSTYYWRIMDPKTDTPVSDVTEFTVVVLSAPQLLKPENEFEFRTPLFFDTQANVLTSRQIVFFEAKDLMKAEAFELQISLNSSFTKIIEQLRSPISTFKVETSQVGVLYWRMRAFRQNQAGPWSQPEEFKITRTLTGEAPEPVEPKSGNKIISKTNEMVLKWNARNNHESFIINISNKKDFSNMKSFRTKEPLLKTELSLGSTYFWRVRAIDNELKVTPYSDTESFRFVKKPKLQAPKIKDFVIELKSRK